MLKNKNSFGMDNFSRQERKIDRNQGQFIAYYSALSIVSTQVDNDIIVLKMRDFFLSLM